MNLDSHKICFIICSNDNLLLSECIHYINHLNVPNGYMIDLISISEAQSMTAGYNEGMNASDAKYKIYMHQDVFILNKNFLYDILSIFGSDSDIGLIGMVGYDTISPDGIMWHKKRYGNIFQKANENNYPQLNTYHYSLKNDFYNEVALIDGLMMITSTDISWNTAEVTGWDFYDVYQCLDFIRNHKKIVVPNQCHPWCMHDDNVFPNLSNYNEKRTQFIQQYHPILNKHISEIKELL